MTCEPHLYLLPCIDSEQMAASRLQDLDIPRDVAAALGRSAGTELPATASTSRGMVMKSSGVRPCRLRLPRA